MTSCPLPSPTPVTAKPDLKGCNECSVHVSLHEFETGGSKIEDWPPVVQQIAAREITRWRDRNPDREIVHDMVEPAHRVCVVVWYHRARAQGEVAA